MNCRHCQRAIVLDEDGRWVDPEATGDDAIWREVCDSHDTFTAEHEPKVDAETFTSTNVIVQMGNDPTRGKTRVEFVDPEFDNDPWTGDPRPEQEAEYRRMV